MNSTLENVDIVFDANRADFAAEKTDKYKGENMHFRSSKSKSKSKRKRIISVE